MAGNIVPRLDNTTTLGTAQKRWKKLYTAEGLNVGTVVLGTPEDGMIEYDGDHLYFVIGDERTQLDNQQSGVGANISANAIVTEFTYENLGTNKYSAVQVPSGAFVHRVVVVVDTAFTGGSSPVCAVSVHGPGSDTLLLAGNKNDLTQAKQWNGFEIIKVPNGQGGSVKLALTGTASAGAGRVVVEFECIPSESGVFVRTGVADTITAQHDFAPDTVQAPFTIGVNAQGQLVTGLNADFLDGKHASEFATSTHSHTIVVPFSWSDIGTPVLSTTEVPALAIVSNVEVDVLAFTGSGLSCVVDVDGDTTDTQLFTATHSELVETGQLMIFGANDIPSGQGGPVRVTLGGSASAGSGRAFVEYALPAT